MYQRQMYRPGSKLLKMLLLLLVVAVLAVPSANSCPSHCNCQNGVAYCSTLKSIPSFFPDDIKTIHIFDSDLDSLPARSFRTLPVNLTELLLYNVKIHTVKTCAFENVRNLNKFSLSDVDIGTLEGGAFGGVRNIHTFTLSSFKIKRVGHHAFKDMRDIRNFEISRGNMSHIETHAFAGLHNVSDMKVYRLSSDKINVAPFGGMTQVGKFNLYLSNLPELPAYIFPSAPKHVSFHANRIKGLACRSLDNWISSHFVVSANKITCDCSLAWIFQEMDYPMALLDGFDCFNPSETQGRKLSYYMTSPLSLPCKDALLYNAECGEIKVEAADPPHQHCSAPKPGFAISVVAVSAFFIFITNIAFNEPT